jgi:glycosyltransferase involved in cell wall biosynthesis
MSDQRPVHRISVIIPTYNKAQFLDLTLASYQHQKYDRFELVVVDDGSTDNTREVVDRYRGPLDIRYISQSNKGRSAARNTAIREASGDLLVFADDDRIAAPGFLAAHAREFSSVQDNTLVLGWQAGFLSHWEQRPEFWSQVGPVLARDPELAPVLSRHQQLQLVSASDIRERFPEMLEKFRLEEPWWGTVSHYLNELSGDLNRFRLSWAFGTTGNMSAPRQRVIEVGMFDEGFSRWGLEDTDLCFRLCQAGARIAVSREGINYHQLHVRAPQLNAEWEKNFHYLWSKSDSLQIPLYYLFTRRQFTIPQVNAIVGECEALEREGRLTLVNELKRVYRLAVSVFQSIQNAMPLELQ